MARRMYLHPATVVGVLTRLEAHGLIKKTRSKEDRRVVWVELTPKGKKLVASAPEVAQGLLVMGLEKTPLSELKEVNKGLKRLVSILGAEGTLPHLILSQEVSLPLKRKKRSKPTKVKPYNELIIKVMVIFIKTTGKMISGYFKNLFLLKIVFKIIEILGKKFDDRHSIKDEPCSYFSCFRLPSGDQERQVKGW